MMPGESQLQRFVDQASGDVLVLHDATSAPFVSTLEGDGVVPCLVGQGGVPSSRWAAVVLAVADVAALRRTVSVLPRLGRTRALACWLAEAEHSILLTIRPEWPAVVGLNARRLPSAGALTIVRFARPAPAHSVFEQLARDAAPASVAGGFGVVVATTLPTPDSAPPADSGLQIVGSAEESGDPALDVPADVVLSPTELVSVPEHHVTGRAPTLVTESDLLLGPIDEGVLNPTGFIQLPENGLADLEFDRQGRLRLRAADLLMEVDSTRGATARHVSRLRRHSGVRVNWEGPDVLGMVRTVAGLAMAGVPLLSGPLPAEAEARLAPGLLKALGEDAHLGSPLRREEHSVRLRRAALLAHSTLAWRGRLATAAGLRRTAFPACSVVLATRRPDQLEFALRQFAKQRGVEAELVVAAHGFQPDEGWMRDRLQGAALALVPMPGDAWFGDVLTAGVRAASGDVIVKMDDDDWYGPDFLTDLLLARHYSGADVVGMTAEYVYLEAIDRTVRRTDESERAAKFVAGGTIMVGRSYLNALGGFRRVHRFVDASLLSMVHASGGTVYRTHGLGYVLRRTASGHTWHADADYFLDPERLGEQWSGFVPSRLMEHHAETP